MKVYRRSSALTMVEVLVAVTVVLALAAITYAVLTNARLAADNSTCLVRLRTMQNAIDTYRVDWGNASATVGTAIMLGLPYHPWASLYTLSTDQWIRARMSSCPLMSRQTNIIFGIAYPPADDSWSPTSYFEATSALGGDTPVWVDTYHNPANLPYYNRGVRRFYLYTTLDSNVRSEFLTGIEVRPPGLNISLRDWVIVKTRQRQQR